MEKSTNYNINYKEDMGEEHAVFLVENEGEESEASFR